MPGKKRFSNKAFWNNFRFKYKISILNENTLEEIAGLRISKLNGVSVFLVTVIIIFLIAATIIAFTPLRNYLPGYMNSDVRKQIVENALRTDSLEKVLNRQSLYIMNIQDIFRGTVNPDTVRSVEELTVLRKDSLMERTVREKEFRRQYEETEKYNLTAITSRAEANGLIFHAPARGIISVPFDVEKNHPGIDIAAAPGESVLATLDGTVVLSAYTAENGYVIILQHTQDFVSEYRHCGMLIKKEGEIVQAGEAIAIVGNAAVQTAGPHLHFGLWYRGKAVNPKNYIIF